MKVGPDVVTSLLLLPCFMAPVYGASVQFTKTNGVVGGFAGVGGLGHIQTFNAEATGRRRTTKKDQGVTQPPVEDMPHMNSTQVDDASTTMSPSEETPVETPSEETPVETPSEETPVETPSEETPVETPSEETPVETPSEETPVETPSEETPVETPSEETPVETPSEETPVETPSEETPVETPVDKDAGMEGNQMMEDGKSGTGNDQGDLTMDKKVRRRRNFSREDRDFSREDRDYSPERFDHSRERYDYSPERDDDDWLVNRKPTHVTDDSFELDDDWTVYNRIRQARGNPRRGSQRVPRQKRFIKSNSIKHENNDDWKAYKKIKYILDHSHENDYDNDDWEIEYLDDDFCDDDFFDDLFDDIDSVDDVKEFRRKVRRLRNNYKKFSGMNEREIVDYLMKMREHQIKKCNWRTPSGRGYAGRKSTQAPMTTKVSGSVGNSNGMMDGTNYYKPMNTQAPKMSGRYVASDVPTTSSLNARGSGNTGETKMKEETAMEMSTNGQESTSTPTVMSSTMSENGSSSGSTCQLRAKCYSDKDCNGGRCYGKHAGTCYCKACRNYRPCTSDKGCGGLKGACDMKTNRCYCSGALKAFGFESSAQIATDFCDTQTCDGTSDTCHGLPCMPGMCLC